MKRKSSLILAFLTTCFTHGFPASAADDVVLVENGVPKAKIYAYPQDLEDEFKDRKLPRGHVADILPAALDDLVLHLEIMSGAPLELAPVQGPGEIEPPGIVLGRLANELGATPPPDEEGYHVLTKDGSVLIGASTHRGIAHGIYGLLESLGCDWVMPGEIGMIVPRRKTVSVPALDSSEEPAFVIRRMWYRGGPKQVTKEDWQRFAEWCRRQRLGFSEDRKDYGQGHGWGKVIRQNQEVFDANPEMLALVRLPDGTLARKGPQLEPANPKVADLIAQSIRDEFENKNLPKDAAVPFSISPADGGGYSVSPESLALGAGRKDPVIGGDDVTDHVIYLANEVLERLGDEYPNVTLSYLAYSVHQDYPARYKPNPRINVVFAPIAFSRLHATEDPVSKTRAYFKGVLEQWHRLSEEQGNTLGFYEYNWNLADNMLPFTRLRMFGEDIPMYNRMGMKWAIIECTKAWSINGAHDYVAAKLLWDPEQEWRSLLHRYCQKSYGNAAPMIERYYLRLADIQREAGQETGSFHPAGLIFDEAFIAAAEKDFDEALQQELTPEQRTRIQYAKHPLGALKLYLDWYHALNAFDFPKASEAYDKMLSHWQQGYDTNSDLVAAEVPGYYRGLIGLTTQEALKYSSAPYEIVVRLDDALRTALDPTGNGERLNFQVPEINDSQWIRTLTYSSNWDSQGLGFYREGSVWYRFPFELPKNAADEGIGLFLGGFDDHAEIWLNGTRVGDSGNARKFGKPVVFDLTDVARPGKENLLAIKISRISNLNENLTGGLFRPSFIFTGPRLEIAERPAKEPTERVLPGGETEKEKN